MNKESFAKFLQNNILTLFTGSEIVGEEPSTNREGVIAQGANGSILVKFRKEDNYRFIIKRVQPFKQFEINLIKSIIQEYDELYKSGIKNEHLERLQIYTIEKAVCKAISRNGSKTLLQLIDIISRWGQRTYEGNNLNFGFLVTAQKMPKSTNPNLHLTQILSKDFSALLTDGINTCMELSANGYLMNYITIPQSKGETTQAPYDYIKMANICTGAKVGVSLMHNGDILIFKDKALVLARRSNKWLCYSHDEIINKISERSTEEGADIRKAIYLTALDTSFTKNGACMVHINKDETDNVLKHIDEKDILIEKYYNAKQDQKVNLSFFYDIEEQKKQEKTFDEFLKEGDNIKLATLKSMIGDRKFQELDRKMRQDLVSIDGATIIGPEGQIIAVGAIIKIEAGSSGGGRLAATKTLAKYGVALKISADGFIEGFKMDRQKLRVRPTFIVG